MGDAARAFSDSGTGNPDPTANPALVGSRPIFWTVCMELYSGKDVFAACRSDLISYFSPAVYPKDLERQLAVHENHSNPSSKAIIFARRRKKRGRAARKEAAGDASLVTNTGKRGVRPGSPGAAPAYRPDPYKTTEYV